MVLKQRDVVDLFLDEGWRPLFLEPSDEPLDAIKQDLQREIAVLLADGQKTIVDRILSCLKDNQAQDFAEVLRSSVSDGFDDCLSKLGKPPSLPCPHERAQRFLLESLEQRSLLPRFLDQTSDLDLAERCGREMKHLRDLQHHDAVVELGQRAAWLKLEHKRIVVNLRESRRAIRRANQLIVLKAHKESPNRSRREYEAAILKAWLADPECSDYVNLLSNVVAFRQRKQASTLNLNSFESEWIDYRVNKRLWNALSETMEGDLRSEG